MKNCLQLLFIILLIASALAGSARAQAVTARNNQSQTSQPPPSPPPSPSVAAITQVLTGRVETAQGPLSGAVVRLPRFNQTCVTNADGSFLFTVPADAGLFAAVVAYPGCADVNTTLQPGGAPAVVQMLLPAPTKAGGKQLKAYMKTARRDVKRSLRQLK